MSVIQNKFSSRDTLSDDHKSLSSNNRHYKNKKHRASYHNNNIPREETYDVPNEEKRPTYIFWILIVFLFLIAVGNLLLTILILRVLRMGQSMESMEFITDESCLKFYGSTDLHIINKQDGHLESFGDDPMEIVGDADSVIMKLTRFGEVTASIDVGEDREKIVVDSFEVKDLHTGEPIFHTGDLNFGLPRGVGKLDLQKAETKRIASPTDSNLLIKSDSYIKLKGSEGTRMDGKEVEWSADQDIFLKSLNKSIILNGMKGVYMDLPSYNKFTDGGAQGKICICMPSGKLFRVYGSANASCLNVDTETSNHPCV